MTFIFEVIKMKIVNIVTLILNIIGGINWGLIGLFKFDLVAWICGGQDSVLNKTRRTVSALHRSPLFYYFTY